MISEQSGKANPIARDLLGSRQNILEGAPSRASAWPVAGASTRCAQDAIGDEPEDAREKPIPLMRPRDEPEAAPRDALGLLRAPTEAIETLTSAPFEICMQSVLAAASLATQAHADVETLGSRKPLSLFFVTVAASGERKSAVDGHALRGVRSLEEASMADYRRRRHAHELRLAKHDAAKRQMLREASREVIDSDADLEALGPPPAPPINPIMLLSDPTFEGVLKHFEDGPASIGVFADEGGQLLGGHAMSPENRLKTAAGFSKLWDGAAVNRTRASGPSQTFFGRRVALHLMAQPGVSERFLGDPALRDQGLLSRCLMAWPASRIGTRLISSTDDVQQQLDAAGRTTERFGDRLANLLEPQDDAGHDDDGRELTPRLLSLSGDARLLLIDFANKFETEQAHGRALSAITGFASKAAEQAARIAGVLTIYEDPTADSVPFQAMQHAVKLTAWYLNEAVRLLEAGQVSEDTEMAELLCAWLKDKWQGDRIDVRTIVRRGPGRLRDTRRIRQLIPILERNSWLVKAPIAGANPGQRPSESWIVVRQ